MVSLILVGCGSSKTKDSNISQSTPSDTPRSVETKDANKPVTESKTFDKVAFNKFLDDTSNLLQEIDKLTNTTDSSKLESVNASLDKVSSINDRLFALKVPDDPTGTMNPYELQSYLAAYNMDFRALLTYKQLKLTNQSTDINPAEMTKKMAKDRELYTTELTKYREICK